MQKSFLRIIYENRRGYMHGVYQTKPLANSALRNQFLNGAGNVHKPAPLRHFEPEMFRERFH
jgi:hypothetical protein